MNDSENKASELLDEARVAALSKGSSTAAIPYAEKAIALGLPKEKELEARGMLASGFREIAGNSGLSPDQMEASTEFSRVIEEFETSANLDREGSFNHYLDPLQRASLRYMDFMCLMRAGRIRETEGRQAAIHFLQDKVVAYDYLPSHPLLQCLKQLGILYAEEGEADLSTRCWHKIVAADPVDRWDEKGKAREAALKEFAREQMSKAKSTKGCSIVLLIFMGLVFLSIFASIQ